MLTMTTFLIVGSTDIEEEEEPAEEETTANFNWLIIPSLMFGAALILAVVAFAMRKIKF